MTTINGTTYHRTTPPRVIEILEAAMNTKSRVRVQYGDTKSGAPWPCWRRPAGYVSCSKGPAMRVPVLLHNSRSRHGCCIFDDCITRIELKREGEKKYSEVYRHGESEERAMA